MWKWYKIQISASVNKDLLEHSHGHSLTYGLWLLLPCSNSWRVATKTTRPTKSKVFTLWSFTEKVCQLLNQAISFLRSIHLFNKYFLRAFSARHYNGFWENMADEVIQWQILNSSKPTVNTGWEGRLFSLSSRIYKTLMTRGFFPLNKGIWPHCYQPKKKREAGSWKVTSLL